MNGVCDVACSKVYCNIHMSLLHAVLPHMGETDSIWWWWGHSCNPGQAQQISPVGELVMLCVQHHDILTRSNTMHKVFITVGSYHLLALNEDAEHHQAKDRLFDIYEVRWSAGPAPQASRSATQHHAAARSSTQYHAASRSTTQHHAAPRSTTQPLQ